tara:strand:+ start:350 stop:592 length:243 start_codon:yes stop_codon:yes gene_type:complete
MSITAAVSNLRDQCKETTLFSVARGSGVSYPVVYRFVKDPSYKIRLDTLQRIEKFFRTDEADHTAEADPQAPAPEAATTP